MTALRVWLWRLGGFFRKERREREFAAEMESHLQMHMEDNLRAGMSVAEARRAARMMLGGLEQTKELYRERRSLPLLETLAQDLRFAVRTLRKNPGFTSIAVLTLALGIGANTAMFSIVNALLLHPYNFRELDRLLMVWESRGMDEGVEARFIAAPDAEELSTNTQIFDGLTLFRCGDFNLSSQAEVQPVRGCAVSPNFFDVLGVAAASGRTFSSEEAQPGADQVAVVSYGFWQRRFGGDPALLGNNVQINGRAYTVVGIMPRGFDYPVPMELWTPLALTPEQRADRSQLAFQALGRLKSGVSLTQARVVVDEVSRRLWQQYPVTNANRRTELLQLRKELYAYTLPLFGFLQAAAVFVLLLACANLANLLFARIFGRQKEIAVRTALGASRTRLARLFLTETVLFALIAGVAAIAVSFWAVKVLRTSISPSWTMWVPGWDGIQVDRSVLAFTVALTVVVGVLFGLSVALHSKESQPYVTLKEAGRAGMPGMKTRMRSALVVAQVTFALVLLVCAGLSMEAFVRLVNVYQGFQAANVLRAEIRLPEKTYRDTTRITGFYERLLRESAALPGAQAAAIVTNSPASNVDNETIPFTINGRPAFRASETPSADLQICSPDYFRALRVPLVAGRLYSNADSASTARVAVISRSMAARFWLNGDALGQQIKQGPASSAEPWMTVVGVVEDVRQNWWNPTTRPTIYEPFLQAPQRAMVLLMRVTANPTSYASGVREIVHTIDDQIAVNGMGTLETEITDSIAIIRILGVLMGLFGGVALALSSVGVYGMLAENVARRTPEIGVRLALGADPSEILKLVVGRALKLAGIGVVIGVPLAFAVNRAMASWIFGIVTVNIALLAGVVFTLMLVAILAAYIPARRAMRVDPIVALRYE